MPKKQTLEEFIKKSNIAHNFKYNYDKSIYINKQTKVIVTCPEHGDFEVTPGAHYILKSGCPECAKISRSKTKSKGLEKFIKQANLKWNSFYNYSKVNYINNYTKVEIICPIHGSFFKDPRSHIDPQRYGGCQSCSKERLGKIISKVQQQKPKGTNREAFIEYCSKIHNNKYSYNKMNYVNMMTPIEIICPIHGVFIQHPINHYQGKGCPECGKHISKSKGEIELCEYIKSIYKGNIISNDRIQLDGKELDIYLPELKLAFEYDGKYWHQLKEEKEPGYHDLKDSLAKEKNINLIHIKEEDWTKNQDETKLKIKETIKTLENNEAFKKKRRIQAIKARLKEYYHLKEMNNYFKRNFIELTRHPADYSLFMDNKSIDRAIETLKSIMKNNG